MRHDLFAAFVRNGPCNALGAPNRHKRATPAPRLLASRQIQFVQIILRHSERPAGKHPVKALLLSSSLSKFVNEVSSNGICPVSRLWSNSKYSNLVRLPKTLGICPVN